VPLLGSRSEGDIERSLELREAPPLGGGFRLREVRRDRRYQLLQTGLARHFKAQGIKVLEVERPKRRRRSSRPKVKSDLSDAESAARGVLAGETSAVPKSADGTVEMIRALRTARRSAMKART
jgi:hypothetical protein